LFGLLVEFMTPLFDLLANFLRSIAPTLRPSPEDSQEFVNGLARQLEFLLPYIRLLGVIVVVLLAGWLIARALTRRMNWAEEEMFQREELDERDQLQERRKRVRPARPVRYEIHAENIRRIYAALLAHAQKSGLERRSAETPFEFLPRLTGCYPELSSELREITQAYVAVHYAEQTATDAQVRSLRALWQNVKAQMTADSQRRGKDGKQE
jgi:hypothetical protein